MKTKLLSAIMLGMPALAISQVSLNASMAPPVNSIFTFYDANVPSPPFTFSKTGTTNTWNFSTLTALPIDEDTTYVIAPSNAPNGSAFPAATHCTYDDGTPNYTMMQINASGVNYLGGVSDPTGSGNYTPIVISPPIQAMTFPYIYGSNGNGAAMVQLTLTGAAVGQPTMDSIRFKSTNNGQRNVIASGDMVIPSGTFPAILERSIDSAIDTVWAKDALLTLGQWLFISATNTTDSSFYWYTNQSLIPYAHALYDSIGLHDVHYFKSMALGVSENANDLIGSVYPNPVSNMLYLNIPGNGNNYQLEIINTLGELIMKGNTTQNKIDVSFLKEGIYFLNLTDGKGKMSTMKFVKN